MLSPVTFILVSDVLHESCSKDTHLWIVLTTTTVVSIVSSSFLIRREVYVCSDLTAK